jgi:hypothetical protein
MDNFAARLQTELVDAGIPVVGVSIGETMNTSTWTVQPSTLQVSSQPYIDAVNTTQWMIDASYATLRLERDLRLTLCDWTQLSDAHESDDNPTGLTPAVVSEWQTYRQQLRNLPDTVSNPANPDWPVPPTS